MIYFPYQNGLSLQEVRRILIIKEVEYAIGILYELYRESPLPAAEISKRQNIPSPFIYRILKKLEAGGILKIKRGANGGYSLSADCDRLTLYDVISVFENTFLVIECMKPGYECNRNDDGCCWHKEFAGIQVMLKKEFKRSTIASLFEK